MRILFVHSIGRKKYGGGERWVVKAASGLQAAGHEVMLAARSRSVLVEEAGRSGVGTIPFNLYSNLSLWQAIRLALLIRRYRFEAIVCKGQELIVCGLAARLSGRPLLIRRAGSPPRRRSRKLVWRTRCFVDGVVTNTHSIREVYARLGLDNGGLVRVVYNGLQLDDGAPAFDFSSRFPGRTIGLCVGRLAAHKGYPFLIDALPLLKEAHPGLLFFVIGDGRDRACFEARAIEKGVEDMIHFAGYIHDPVPYFKGCDFFLHPSLYEGMPNAAMEAMAYGKPVVMTRVNGAEELSNQGALAVLIPASDPEAIARAVADLLGDRQASGRMAAAAKGFVRSRFTMEKMVADLEGFIRERMQVKNRDPLPRQSH